LISLLRVRGLGLWLVLWLLVLWRVLCWLRVLWLRVLWLLASWELLPGQSLWSAWELCCELVLGRASSLRALWQLVVRE
jgi:hypothetical protein